MKRIKRYKDCTDKEKYFRCNINITFFVIFMLITMIVCIYYMMTKEYENVVLGVIIYFIYACFLVYVYYQKKKIGIIK